jgi:N-hydroxyarylamine O-acetyltransferase
VRPDRATLDALAFLHPLAIPFEALDPLFRRPVLLDTASLQRKMIDGGRGGWCFEHNLLLAAALDAIGFGVEGLSARVMWNVPEGTLRPRTHMVLLVTLGDTPLIVDAGFGGLTLTAPLRLETDVAQETPHEPFRLRRADADFIVEAFVAGEWKPLYRFDLQRQVRADYELANWYLCTSPASYFLSTLVAARAQRDRRYALANASLAVHHADGYTERRVLESGPQLRDALVTLFGIAVPEGEEVDRLLACVVAGTLTQGA